MGLLGADTLAQIGTPCGMQSVSDGQRVRNAINNFAGGLALVMDHELNAEAQIRDVTLTLIQELQRTATPKPHPASKIALGGVVTLFLSCVALAYGYGALNNRVEQLEQLPPRVQVVEERTANIEVLAEEIRGLRRDIDRIMPAKSQ